MILLYFLFLTVIIFHVILYFILVPTCNVCMCPTYIPGVSGDKGCGCPGTGVTKCCELSVDLRSKLWSSAGIASAHDRQAMSVSAPLIFYMYYKCEACPSQTSPLGTILQQGIDKKLRAHLLTLLL